MHSTRGLRVFKCLWLCILMLSYTPMDFQPPPGTASYKIRGLVFLNLLNITSYRGPLDISNSFFLNQTLVDSDLFKLFCFSDLILSICSVSQLTTLERVLSSPFSHSAHSPLKIVNVTYSDRRPIPHLPQTSPPKLL